MSISIVDLGLGFNTHVCDICRSSEVESLLSSFFTMKYGRYDWRGSTL